MTPRHRHHLGLPPVTRVHRRKTGIDRDTVSSLSTSQPVPIRIPIPWDIQRYIIDSVAHPRVMVDEDNNVLGFPDLTNSELSALRPMDIVIDRIGACQTLWSCSLVCRDWATASRELMFQWICLSNHQQTDKLYTLFRDPQSSHLAQKVRRLSIVYSHPYKKIGEAIPRIIGMRLSRLEYLDLCTDNDVYGSDYPMFPFHPSLRAQLSQLNQIRILHLHHFRFSHFAEFRRLVCGFAGVRHLTAIFIKIGKDKLGDYRPIHRSREWQIPTKLSWLWHESSWVQEYKQEAAYDPSILWVANIPNSYRFIEISLPKAPYPVLTPHVANAIGRINLLSRWESMRFPVTWRWICEEGSRSSGGMVRDWILRSVSSDETNIRLGDFIVRFHVEFDNLQDVPLGFEHLIEVCIPHMIHDTLALPAFLYEVFEELQECLGEFRNTRKLKLAFLTSVSSDAASWRSEYESTTKERQKKYAAIIAITEEFMRSQTDVDLDFTIDGLPPEELHLLISSVQTNELLWPTHLPIPWNIQRHILESMPSYVLDENDDVPVFDQLIDSAIKGRIEPKDHLSLDLSNQSPCKEID
ncbi:hypothetical protein NLI96_g6624 [Meripilus lineatus]|uniref:Uncharacterized protein n=1 Tax=Meripilus lineatus TaxID=2056292 RepID=A0AAD5YHY9_9APHY|nr:hypothetical protein NLI96_g6624 [Physisporinus lineatus]